MLKKLKRYIILTIIAFCTISTSWVLLYKWVPVKWTPLMLKRTVQNIGVKDYKNSRTWVDIENISPIMVRAVIASEDGRFMEHWGFDLKELRKMRKEYKKKGKKKNTQKRYCFFHIRPPQSAWIRGIRTVKVVPSPSLLYTLMAPRCIRTALLVMARPSPVPPISLEWDLSTR